VQPPAGIGHAIAPLVGTSSTRQGFPAGLVGTGESELVALGEPVTALEQPVVVG
jgi:hypothetical protein